MDFIVIKGKLFAKLVSWDLAAVEMSDQETIQKYLDGGYEPFGAVPHIKRDNKAILTQNANNGVITDNLIFMRKANVQLSPVKNEKEKKEATNESVANTEQI